MVMTSRETLPPSGRAITTSRVTGFKSEWPRSNRNRWPTSFRNQWPTSPGIRIGDGVRGYKLPDRARDFAARFYLQLAVGNRPGDVAAAADQQPLADRELTLKA